MFSRCTWTVFLASATALIGCRSDGHHRRNAIPLAARTTYQADVDAHHDDDEPAPRLIDTEAESAVEPGFQQVADSQPESMTSLPVPVTMRLTLRQAIETSLSQNPDIVAQRQAEGPGIAALGVAQTYPFNPYVQVQATPYQEQADAGPGTVYHYVLLMQQIQLAGQQGFREQAGAASLNSIRWNVLQAELLNVAMTERLYFTALYQKGLRDLAKLNSDNNQEFLRIIQRQLEAGQATAADTAIVRMDARSTLQQYHLAEANYQTALLDLRRQLGFPLDVPLELDDDLENWTWKVGDRVQLAAQSAYRPDVMAARADMDTSRANVRLADASRVPDLQIGPYYQRTQNGAYFLGFRGQMDIPVVNDGVPLLRQREAEFQQRCMIWNQLRIRAGLEAQAATDRYERARKLVGEFATEGTESLPVELQQLEEQFRAGEVDVVRVIQARTSLIQNRRADLDTINELLQSAAVLTAAAGVPIETLTTTASSINLPVTEE